MIIITSPQEKLAGELSVPGDKSITHRAIMLGALARGTTEVNNFLDADDCWSTINCLRAMGVKISRKRQRLLIEGRNKKLLKPAGDLNAGNSGTTARLILGLLAGQNFKVKITGDQSLQSRPMKRVIDPLEQMGAIFEEKTGNLPLTIKGSSLQPIVYKTPRASAQVKSAILLAALYADGKTVIEEPCKSRNHTELMLACFGVEPEVENNKVAINGGISLKSSQVMVPGDLSAAAFLIVAAAIIPGSELLIKEVGVNATRKGIIEVLLKMGAHIELQDEKIWGKEPVANIYVKGGARLKGVNVGGEMIPRLIDEIPSLAVAASLAEGETKISDASELRIKESDRIATLAAQLNRMGARIAETEDGMIIKGTESLQGTDLEACGDHRIAMALAVAGLVAKGETAICGAEVINISFPGFMQTLRSLVDK